MNLVSLVAPPLLFPVAISVALTVSVNTPLNPIKVIFGKHSLLDDSRKKTLTVVLIAALILKSVFSSYPLLHNLEKERCKFRY